MSSVAAIIPTYNRERELRRALLSVVAQTRPVDEIIVVDDGSADETGTMMAKEFSGVIYIAQRNAGVSAARNAGVARATSEWIALLDSDDEWSPNKIKRQMEEAGQNPDFLLGHTNEVWIRNGRRVNQGDRHAKSGGYIFQKCLPLCAISPSSVLVKKRLLEEIGGFDERLPACEDYDLWLRICSVHPVLYIDEPLVTKYGGHADQLSRKYWGMDRFRIEALARIVESGSLQDDDRRAAAAMLCSKIDVFLAGARKRGRTADVEAYGAMRKKYEIPGPDLTQ